LLYLALLLNPNPKANKTSKNSIKKISIIYKNKRFWVDILKLTEIGVV
jgi:hypothetical protein